MTVIRKLERRAFLAAMGVGVATPLALTMSRVAVAAPSPRPVRLFIMYVPHGFPIEHFDPVRAGGAFDFKAKGIGGYSPFEPYKQYFRLLRGIGMADGASNHGAIRAALTGVQEGG